MATATVKVEKDQVMIALAGFRDAVADKGAMLKICGGIMRTSIAYTFREEGSPAGSWPQLAASTLKKKGYTAGHKLLILSGRLFGSISYAIAGDTLTIGTNLIYAAVHQYGSKDWMGGIAGPRMEAMMTAISAHRSLAVQKFRRYGKQLRTGKDGRTRAVRVREIGPDNAKRFGVRAHTRRQNIPQRMFLLFRPEDPTRMQLGIDAWLQGKTVRIGKIGSTTATAGGAA